MGVSKAYQDLAALGLAVRLCEMADDSRTVWATVDVLAERFGMKRDTITAMIRHLERSGIVWKGRGKVVVTLRKNPFKGMIDPLNGINDPLNGHEHEDIKTLKTLEDHESLRILKILKIEDKNTHAHPVKKIPTKPKRVAADDPGFKAFWADYPRKVGKIPAAKWWESRWPNDQELMSILEGLDTWVEHWQARGTEIQYIPHPVTWLRAERWTEPPEAQK